MSRRSVALLMTLSVTLGVSSAWAASALVVPSPSQVFTACYDSGGAVKFVAPGTTACPKGWSGPVTWNAVGPAGAAGPVGPQGPQGDPGPAGPAGTGLASMDDLVGLPCRTGTPRAGTVNVTYDADLVATITCVSSEVPIRVLDSGRVPTGTPVVVHAVVSGVSVTGLTVFVQARTTEPGNGIRVVPVHAVDWMTLQPGTAVQVSGTYTVLATEPVLANQITDATVTVEPGAWWGPELQNFVCPAAPAPCWRALAAYSGMVVLLGPSTGLPPGVVVSSGLISPWFQFTGSESFVRGVVSVPAGQSSVLVMPRAPGDWG